MTRDPTMTAHTISDRIVAISGAAGGIGQATARRFRDRGDRLVLIDRDETALRALAQALGGEPQVIVCDQRHDDAIERTTAAAGGVDVFVNNAGIIIRKPLLAMTHVEISDLIAVNAAGSFKMAIGMARAMAARGSGTIVNVSSQHAFVGANGRGVYAATKAAVVQFTRTAAVEWAPLGIRVVGIAPGPVDSPMTAGLLDDEAYREAVIGRMPIGRMITTREIAGMIEMLADPAMAVVLGHTIVADGGACLS